MIRDDQLPELRQFRKAEKAMSLATSPHFAKLVVQNDNEFLPIHRWFKFKESFSANLLLETIQSIGNGLGKNIRLLDPFCGVATSLVASQEMSALGYRVESIGIERNPFIAFVAQTKVRWPEVKLTKFKSLASTLIDKQLNTSVAIPGLSSLTSGRCISRHFCKRLLRIQEVIRHDGSDATHDALLLGLASAIEPVSYIRKDGRALRIVERSQRRLSIILKQKWSNIAEDIQLLQQTLTKAMTPKILVGDGRSPSLVGIESGSIDLVITSPPYPNNIDYSEVYKLELWLLKFMKDKESFLSLRKKTFRSHPACSQPNELPSFLSTISGKAAGDIIQPLLERMEHSSERWWRQKVLLGYCHDMWISLREQQKCLRNGGYAIFVVGNSLHGGAHFPYLIPTDLIVGSLAKLVGFRVENIHVARILKRRLTTNHFLRESIVVLRKVDDQ